MQTIQRINCRSTRIEFTAIELVLLDAAIFDAVVRIYKDSKAFDITNPDDDTDLIECRMDENRLRGIQKKLEFARKQIELDSAPQTPQPSVTICP